MDVNFEEDQQWEEEAVVIAKRVEEEYQKEKMRSDQMQQQQMLDQNQKDEESTVRKSKRISKDKVSKEGKQHIASWIYGYIACLLYEICYEHHNKNQLMIN